MHIVFRTEKEGIQCLNISNWLIDNKGYKGKGSIAELCIIIDIPEQCINFNGDAKFCTQIEYHEKKWFVVTLENNTIHILDFEILKMEPDIRKYLEI